MKSRLCFVLSIAIAGAGVVHARGLGRIGDDQLGKPISASTAPAQLSSEQIQQIVRQAADKDVENYKKQVNYTYLQNEQEQRLDDQGGVKSTETRTYEIMILYGQPVRKLIARNGQPLSPEQAKKEDGRIQKIIDLHKNEGEHARAKRLADQEKGREENREFVKEIADAYNFQFVGNEEFDGRNTYVIDADPKPGYKPHTRQAEFLTNFRFRAWVDQAEEQWVKLNIQCVKTVSIGLFLVRVHKGSNIQAEQTRVNDEVWLPKHVAAKIDARLALVKGLRMELDVLYSDFKKFRAETKVLPGNAAPEP